MSYLPNAEYEGGTQDGATVRQKLTVLKRRVIVRVASPRPCGEPAIKSRNSKGSAGTEEESENFVLLYTTARYAT
jgi:hypothetical protein